MKNNKFRVQYSIPTDNLRVHNMPLDQFSEIIKREMVQNVANKIAEHLEVKIDTETEYGYPRLQMSAVLNVFSNKDLGDMLEGFAKKTVRQQEQIIHFLRKDK